ncbi:unnamed protein product [Arctogadus glacialis]
MCDKGCVKEREIWIMTVREGDITDRSPDNKTPISECGEGFSLNPTVPQTHNGRHTHIHTMGDTKLNVLLLFASHHCKVESSYSVWSGVRVRVHEPCVVVSACHLQIQFP